MNGFGSLLGAALLFSSLPSYNTSEWKERILKEWRESANLPRKKKKKKRKQLQLDWSIACWNPFEEPEKKIQKVRL